MRQASETLMVDIAKMVSREDLDAAARALGLRGRDGVMQFDNEEEVTVLVDYALHNIVRDGQNAIDRFAQRHTPADGSDEMLLLRAMRRARYEIISIKSAIPGVGLLCEALRIQGPFLLINVNLSRTAEAGQAFAGRILSPTGNWWMTTGVILPLDRRSLAPIFAGMKEHERRPGGEAEMPEHERAALIIRSCLAAGASRQVRTAEPGAEPAGIASPALPLRAAPKTGRNDPCPCGSGKKHKKCCGA